MSGVTTTRKNSIETQGSDEYVYYLDCGDRSQIRLASPNAANCIH